LEDIGFELGGIRALGWQQDQYLVATICITAMVATKKPRLQYTTSNRCPGLDASVLGVRLIEVLLSWC